MKTALIIPIYNRPEYLAQCLDSLKRADLTDTALILINDYSTDAKTNRMFEDFFIPNIPILKFVNTENGGVKKALLLGLEVASKFFNPTYYINLDSDAIVKPDFIQKLIALKQEFPEHIVSGFNSMTKNRNGSERHIVLHDEEDFCLKKSIGGINMLFEEHQAKIVLRTLSEAGNWDHKLSKLMEAEGFPMVCVKPSVVQHIGFRSSMGHNHDKPDIAEDFDFIPKLKLPNVALFILDTVNPTGLIHAVKQSTKEIDFKEVVVLTSEKHVEQVRKELDPKFVVETMFGIDSKEEYSEFMVRDLANSFAGSFSHVLVIQADGFVVNPKAWDDEFLKCDYIGAKWWFKDKFNVGNGGFSLRSMKLINFLATCEEIKKTHPEDEIICRTYGDYLTKQGFKFAPETIADKFSFESYGKVSNAYNGSFGFHGFGIDFRRFPKLSGIVQSIQNGVRARSYGQRLTKR